MLAIAERIHPKSTFGVVEIVWHRPTDPDACDGDCDYHPIVCGEPGISVPGGITDVPEKLTEPGQRWCTACLAHQVQAAPRGATASTGRVSADAHPALSDQPPVVTRDETGAAPRSAAKRARSVRVHGGRVDHTASKERHGRWRMACGSLPVDPRDFDRALCGTPCRGCARALRLAADPAAATARAHAASVRRRETSGQAPLPGSGPHPTATDLAHEENTAS